MAAGGLGAEGNGWARLIGLARLTIRYWALLGGFTLVALVAMTAASAVSNLILNKPFPGDFEIVKHGIAIAAFAFLPYCQLTGSNVTADIFTERMSDRAKSMMVLLAAIIAALVAVALFRQMWLGMLDYIQYGEAMVSVPIKLWTAFPPALISLALLFIAALITAGESWLGLKRAGQQILPA